MKHILFVLFLLTFTCSANFVQQASAQTVPVTHASFTAKVNQMDTYIGAGNMTMAQTTWNDVHDMMLAVLAVSKKSIHDATSPADKTNHTNILTNQIAIYNDVWQLKTNLSVNRVAIHTKLGLFNATIY